jgi:hypothetical protein
MDSNEIPGPQEIHLYTDSMPSCETVTGERGTHLSDPNICPASQSASARRAIVILPILPLPPPKGQEYLGRQDRFG